MHDFHSQVLCKFSLSFCEIGSRLFDAIHNSQFGIKLMAILLGKIIENYHMD